MNSLGIDESWIKGGLDIDLINQVLAVIAKKRQTKEILPSQEDVLNASSHYRTRPLSEF